MVTKKCPECGEKTLVYFPLHMDGKRSKWECSNCDYEEQPTDEELLPERLSVIGRRKP